MRETEADAEDFHASLHGSLKISTQVVCGPDVENITSTHLQKPALDWRAPLYNCRSRSTSNPTLNLNAVREEAGAGNHEKGPRDVSHQSPFPR
jgi:hypothetical protein